MCNYLGKLTSTAERSSRPSENIIGSWKMTSSVKCSMWYHSPLPLKHCLHMPNSIQGEIWSHYFTCMQEVAQIFLAPDPFFSRRKLFLTMRGPGPGICLLWTLCRECWRPGRCRRPTVRGCRRRGACLKCSLWSLLRPRYAITDNHSAVWMFVFASADNWFKVER